MNDQQLAAVKQALEALESFDGVGDVVTWEKQWKLCIKARESLLSIISQDALDKMAEDARTIGLRLDDWDKIGCVNHDCDQCKAAAQPAPVQDLPFGVGGGLVAIKTLLGRDPCVHANTAIEMIDAILKEHPAAQPAPVQEPVAQSLKDAVFTVIEGFTLPHDVRKILESAYYNAPPAAQPAYTKDDIERAFSAGIVEGEKLAIEAQLPAAQPAVPPMHASGLVAIKTLLSRDPCAHAKVAIEMIDVILKGHPAPQPVPVKTYHDGKPWPVQPKPWVGLSEEDIYQVIEENTPPQLNTLFDMAKWIGGIIAAKLKEKNHDH
jgi:hypothetical protein